MNRGYSYTINGTKRVGTLTNKTQVENYVSWWDDGLNVADDHYRDVAGTLNDSLLDSCRAPLRGRFLLGSENLDLQFLNMPVVPIIGGHQWRARV